MTRFMLMMRLVPMMRFAKILTLIAVGLLARPIFVSNLNGANCMIDCMSRAPGCNNSSTISCSGQNDHQRELCEIRCRGQSADAAWGSIAYSTKEKVYGFTYGKSDKATADKQAVQFCVKQGGTKCFTAASFNNTCGAIAASGDLVAWGADPNRYNAEQRAISECRRLGGKMCEVRSSLCSRSF